MSSQNLRDALKRAGIDPDELAEAIGVDIRTVRRWLAGTPPHPRRRRKIAGLLDTPEQELWPELAPPARPPTSSEPVVQAITDPVADAGTETLAAYPAAGHPLAPDLVTVIANATLCVDLLDETLEELLARRDVIDTLIARARGGCRVRILVAIPGRYLQPLLDHPGIEIRAYDHAVLHAVHRSDEEMLLTLRIPDGTEDPGVVLHLAREQATASFDRLAQHFETGWAAAFATIRTIHDIDGSLDAPEDRIDADPFEHSAVDEPPPPARAPLASSPRRWPRRPPQ